MYRKLTQARRQKHNETEAKQKAQDLRQGRPVKSYWKKDAKRRVSGGKDLPGTAEYPSGSLFELWQRQFVIAQQYIKSGGCIVISDSDGCLVISDSD